MVGPFPSVERRIPTCSADLEKSIVVSLILIGFVIDFISGEELETLGNICRRVFSAQSSTLYLEQNMRVSKRRQDNLWRSLLKRTVSSACPIAEMTIFWARGTPRQDF